MSNEYEIRRNVAYPKVTDLLRMVEHADRIGFDREKTSLEVVISVREDGQTTTKKKVVTPVGLILRDNLDDDEQTPPGGGA